jgi:hypothetical protein
MLVQNSHQSRLSGKVSNANTLRLASRYHHYAWGTGLQRVSSAPTSFSAVQYKDMHVWPNFQDGDGSVLPVIAVAVKGGSLFP